MQLQEILQTALRQDASDIHLISGHPPIIRVHTVMTPMDLPMLAPKSVKEYLSQMISELQMKRFEDEKDLIDPFDLARRRRHRSRHRQYLVKMNDVAPGPLQAHNPGVGVLDELVRVINEPGQPSEHRQGQHRRHPDQLSRELRNLRIGVVQDLRLPFDSQLERVGRRAANAP